MDKNQENSRSEDQSLKQQQQAVDQQPGEERGDAEQVSNEDLKGKKVDADPEREEDRPSK